MPNAVADLVAARIMSNVPLDMSNNLCEIPKTPKAPLLASVRQGLGSKHFAVVAAVVGYLPQSEGVVLERVA